MMIPRDGRTELEIVIEEIMQDKITLETMDAFEYRSNKSPKHQIEHADS